MSEKVKLTEEQRAIVETTASDVVVIATAAAGKTRCITERVRWLLEQGVPGDEIVVITFTNAAAEEISERLDNPVGPFIGTIHSLANTYLRRAGIDTSKLLNEEKFDELFELIEEHHECIPPVTHLIVDEAQDSNPLHFNFLIDLIQPKNYMLMGDHRQSIYRWNGATPEYVLNLIQNPEVTTYTLTENYRNGRVILEYAKDLIRYCGKEYEDWSKPMRGVEGNVIIRDYAPIEICKTIKRYVERGTDEYKDWFIVTRTNAQAEEMMKYLRQYKVPCDSFKKANLDSKGLKGKMNEDTVKVLTIHTAKGLEAKNVVVVGALFKNTEERCLGYVAATRAKDLLVWTNMTKHKKPKASYWGG